MTTLLERALVAVAVIGFAAVAFNWWLPQLAAQKTVAEFELQRHLVLSELSQDRWAEARVANYSSGDADDVVAVLRVNRIGIAVPVYEGVSGTTLNKGVGWLPGTAIPGGHGNTVLSAHRDSFFRNLERARLGDNITLLTSRDQLDFEVYDIEIVSPDDSNPVIATQADILTLVTCYPFHHVGPSPLRYILRARRLSDSEPRSAV